MRVVKRFLVFLIIPFSLFFFSACSNKADWNAIQQGKELKIAILVPSSDYEAKSSFITGIRLATEDAKGKGYKVSYKLFSDDNNFDKGVALAKEIIEDDEYQMAFSFQSMDTFDTVAKLFEEAKKPLFSIEGADDATMKKQNKYIFSLQTSAENFGKAAGRYAVKKSYKKIAIAHSEYSFEYNFVEGFNDSVDEDSSVKVVDIVAGPYKEQELENIFARWSTLRADTVVLSFSDVSWGIKLISHIKTIFPDISIIADPYFNDKSLYEGYEKYLEGVVMPSNYPVISSDNLEKFYEQYKSSLKDVSSIPFAIQGFDLVNAIVLRMQNNSSVEDFVNAMKSKEGYEGVSTIKFSVRGDFEGEIEYLIVRNGELEKVNI